MQIATASQMREIDRAAIQGQRDRLYSADGTGGRGRGGGVRLPGPRQGRPRGGVLRAGQQRRRRLAAARLLLGCGMEVRAFLVGDRERMDPPNAGRWSGGSRAAGGRWRTSAPNADFAAWCLGAQVMVDALYGIGLDRPLEGDAYAAVQMMDTCRVPVVSGGHPQRRGGGHGQGPGRRRGGVGDGDLHPAQVGTAPGGGGRPLRKAHGGGTSASPRTWSRGWTGRSPQPSLRSCACPGGPGTPTRGTMAKCTSWAAAWATAAHRSWRPGRRCAAAQAW